MLYEKTVRGSVYGFLIGGASHAGKTLLAQHLPEKYHYPYLSIDHLKMGLIRSGQTVVTPMDDDLLTDYLWPVVREMVKTVIENHFTDIPKHAGDHRRPPGRFQPFGTATGSGK